MLDFRIETFLTLCDTMNYTKAALRLNLTQPAVTQHIKYLESFYQTPLFVYNGKKLYKTPKGELLELYAKSIRHSVQKINQMMKSPDGAVSHIHIGATKTIGEYVIAEKINRYLEDGNKNLSLTVDNTGRLLKLLEEGKLDFALIEGTFDKSRYAYQLFREEEFIGICAKTHRFANREIAIEDLFSESIILRESGSGTRDILEQFLNEHSFSIDCFQKQTEISNFYVIKRLVGRNIGISFVYRSVMVATDCDIAAFSIKKLPVVRELNYVFLKNSMIEGDLKNFRES
ncbi:MAG: LysR family transcriptional regulator [Oscillospiraceae bacterium]